MKKIILVISVTILVLAVTYFARLDRLAATANVATWAGVDLWQGTWLSEKTAKQGIFHVVLKQEGSNITGSIKIGGSPITKGGKISGTINGDKLEFGLVKDKRGELKYFGTIEEDKMTGTWQIPIIKDHGTWKAIKSVGTESSG